MTKKTKKIIVPKSENTRAQRAYLLLIGLLIWFNGITVLAMLARIITGKDVDPLSSLLFTTVFLCLIIGLWAIFYIHPPLHYLIIVGALTNLIISFYAGAIGYIQGLMSIVIIYIGIRFPIKFEITSKILK